MPRPSIAAGADGVAVISALSAQNDPQAAARQLRAIVDRALARDDDRHRRHHRGLGLRRRRRHPGRPENFFGAGVYGACVITALTAQNTRGVTAHPRRAGATSSRAQIDAVFSDLAVNAVKIGMLSTPGAIAAVAAGLER